MSGSLKLYGFYPNGHGQYSFFTMARSEEEAFQRIDAEIKDYDSYYVHGWGTDYYTVEVVEQAGILTNNND